MSTLSGDLRQLIESDQQTARPVLRDLAERLPRSIEARSLLAQSYLRSLELTPALENYRLAHELEPNNLGLRHQMGLCAIALGDYAQALAIFADAAKLAPTEHSEAMAALMLHRLGRAGEAVKAYSTLLGKLKRDHNELPHVLRGMTMLLRDAGAPLASERFLQELVSLYRLDPQKIGGLLIERDNSIDFSGWTRFAHKSDLARALNRRRDIPGAPCFPETFVLPEDREAFQRYAASAPGALFIVKPQRGTGGQGIFVTGDAATVAAREDIVAQRYVERPFLVDGRKGHIRLYGLVTSLSPFRAYLYREGIVRFAPDLYDIGAAGLANVHGHVTNTALHVGHPGLQVSENPNEENVGAVWSLTAYLARAGEAGLDVEKIRTGLREVTRGFLHVLEAEGVFAEQSRAAPRRAFPSKLFGLDVLLGETGTAWLIEAQRKPALGGSALVKRINGRLFQTVFEMSAGFLFDDSMPAERIAGIAKEPAALLQREAEHEAAHRGLFELLP